MEAESIRLGLKMAQESGWPQVTIESDALEIINVINSKDQALHWEIQVIVSDILLMREQGVHPRLDLLDISSVLSSSLYNSSQFDISSLLGVHEPVLNSELLRLATTLLSSQRENPQLFLQNLQENKLCNPQLQNHFSTFQPNQLQSTPIQEFTSCTNSSPVCAPFLSETHLVQANGEQFPSNSADFGCQNSPPNVWQENGVASDLTENFIPTPNYGNYGYDQQPIMEHLSENSTFGSINNSHQSFSFGSVLSTPSSSPTPLNSSSTYLNCSTEDERDSYCSNLLKFEIPNILGVNEFM
ncbi:hypothetical protein HHK36_032003 [Tetracentron sinense]|uniref:RNase H type-1 domain-containing protein n=1 Tax=Tetracentron sinense TaxID=13715 RepID=A0A835CZZ5_TETSI|nr:hypothetical protein HHK36_032003 [Tetracentron sinense]